MGFGLAPAKKKAAGPEPAARRRHTAQTDDVAGTIGEVEVFVSPHESHFDMGRPVASQERGSSGGVNAPDL